MLWRGFQFGLILQFAVGPICLLTFIVSSSFDIIAGELIVIAATLVDAAYIGLSAGGIARLMRNEAIQRRIKAFGVCVLIGFGTYMIWQVLYGEFPQITLFGSSYLDFFLEGAILTVSNPLTILFWGGVFAVQVADYHLNEDDMVRFGTGCVLATFTFLTGIAILGRFAGAFLSSQIILGLNGLVGLALLYFAVQMWRKP